MRWQLGEFLKNLRSQLNFASRLCYNKCKTCKGANIMFYVYEWYIVSTNEVIYVGKGTKNRYKVRKHNRLFDEMIKRFECSSRIVKEFENENDAYHYEYLLIEEMKSKNQCVCNIQKGGFGGNKSWWTDEMREHYSKNNVMKSQEQRKRMSVDNPMKNPETALKVNSQKRKAVIIGDKEFKSMTDACNEYKVCFEVIQNWCKKGINRDGELCRYKDEEQKVFSDKRYNKGCSKPLTYLGKHYEAAIDLVNELNVNESTVLKWLKKGFDSNGNVCRYDDDTRDLVFKPNKYAKKRIIVNGVRYETITEASKKLGVCTDTIRSALNHKHKSRNLICEYDNQKPSQEKSDNSILEGSTTNG